MSEGYRNRSLNAVLVKDDVGKAKPTIYNLPPEGFAYGRSEPADAEGAREVTMHWAAHVPRPQQGPDCQDFRKLNRTAAKSGVRNAKDLVDFRRSIDIKLIPGGPAGVLPKVIPSDVIPSFSYGQKSRPSTPIAHVVGNQYATEHEEALDVQYRMLEESRKAQEKTKIKLTKASKDRIAGARSRMELIRNPQEPKEPFKLTKFKKIGSKMKLPGLRGSASMPTLERLPPEPVEDEVMAASAYELDMN
eukprot:CAMPEP_0197654102 /NCGR_PEP_ID=MMETSP1338-20131121/38653_1 /TAXON_ID=43686 ORGANISM="Pelagodinium beii, Strain RCC1491" /NCGR_SAMPLE_ID=MMETSP1338 /ASSEMBLY_ACC=CAM_ASM_000754 /LENGTH=246 /DNA_ID=CAMNT_0043229489 /DNA_START=86 /DNA_END=826 /DNA_ORIENTATION=-